MYYTYFEFENFKGIRRTRLDLLVDGNSRRIFTLVGLNESGKTTILDAMDHFSPSEDDQDVSPKDLTALQLPDPHDLIPIAERANFNGSVTIVAGVHIDSGDTELIKADVRKVARDVIHELPSDFKVTITYIFKNSRFEKRTTLWPSVLGKATKPTGQILRPISSDTNRSLWTATVGAIKRRLPKIWYFPNFLFEFPDEIHLVPREDEPTSNRLYRALFQDILDSLHKDLNISTHIVARATSEEQSDKVSLNQLLLDVGREVTRSVVHAWNDLFHTRELDNKRVAVALGPMTSRDDGTRDVSVRFLLEDSDGIFSIRERSLGFRWFFVYLLLTTYRGQKRAKESEIVFLFDEPASNLHSTAQGLLLGSLRRLSENAIVLYTTHSHHLIDPDLLGTTFVVSNEGLDPSSVSSTLVSVRTDIRVQPFRNFAAQHPNRSYYFQPVLDVLEYAPSRLETIPAVVMVEGRSDYYLLRYFQEVIHPVVKSSVSLLPGTGAGSLKPIVQLYLAWGRPFIVLLDSDSAGKQAKRGYEEKFGGVVAPLLTDLATEVSRSEVRAIESLLALDDKLAFQRLINQDSAKFDKKLLHKGVELALLTRTSLTMSTQATSDIGGLLSRLAERLELA
jgi:hypothetical protein